MKRIIRYWNQNRKKIITTVSIIVFFFMIIQLLNYLTQKLIDNEDEKLNLDYNKPIQSVISGEIISEEITDKNTQTIEEFVRLCNQRKYENAFSLLSNDCKQEVFSNDISFFINSYCNNIFKTSQTFNIDLWLSETRTYTYKIKFFGDNLLATGGSQTNQNVEDYITIIKEGDKEKLNIKGFIKKEEINQVSSENNVEIIVNNKSVFKDYEIYNITINNKTSETIKIANESENKNIYLLDNDDIKYPVNIYEIDLNNLIINSYQQRNLNMRFNKIYNTENITEKMKFDNIVLNFKEGKMNTQKITINIDI